MKKLLAALLTLALMGSSLIACDSGSKGDNEDASEKASEDVKGDETKKDENEEEKKSDKKDEEEEEEKKSDKKDEEEEEDEKKSDKKDEEEEEDEKKSDKKDEEEDEEKSPSIDEDELIGNWVCTDYEISEEFIDEYDDDQIAAVEEYAEYNVGRLAVKFYDGGDVDYIFGADTSELSWEIDDDVILIRDSEYTVEAYLEDDVLHIVFEDLGICYCLEKGKLKSSKIDEDEIVGMWKCSDYTVIEAFLEGDEAELFNVLGEAYYDFLYLFFYQDGTAKWILVGDGVLEYEWEIKDGLIYISDDEETFELILEDDILHMLLDQIGLILDFEKCEEPDEDMLIGSWVCYDYEIDEEFSEEYTDDAETFIGNVGLEFYDDGLVDLISNGDIYKGDWEIKDGIVYVNDGEYECAVMCLDDTLKMPFDFPRSSLLFEKGEVEIAEDYEDDYDFGDDGYYDDDDYGYAEGEEEATSDEDSDDYYYDDDYGYTEEGEVADGYYYDDEYEDYPMEEDPATTEVASTEDLIGYWMGYFYELPEGMSDDLDDEELEEIDEAISTLLDDISFELEENGKVFLTFGEDSNYGEWEQDGNVISLISPDGEVLELIYDGYYLYSEEDGGIKLYFLNLGVSAG